MMNQMRTFMMTLPLLALAACASDTETGDDADASYDHIITTEDGSMDFTPEDLTISVGDVVRFEMTATHNAIEVSQETYDNRGISALDGGFEVDFGETKDITFDEAGAFYYVCQPHVSMDMIGTITVE